MAWPFSVRVPPVIACDMTVALASCALIGCSAGSEKRYCPLSLGGHCEAILPAQVQRSHRLVVVNPGAMNPTAKKKGSCVVGKAVCFVVICW